MQTCLADFLLHDTMLDLFADLGGALAGLGLLHVLEGNRHKRTTSLGIEKHANPEWRVRMAQPNGLAPNLQHWHHG